MKDPIKEFELLRKLVVMRLSSVLGEAPLAALLSTFDDYQQILSDALSRCNKETKDVKDENAILRSLAGANDTEVTARLLRQGEELRFLREQLLSMREEREKYRNGHETAQLEREEVKKELSACRLLRDEEQKRFQDDLESLARQLKAFEQKIREQQENFEKEKETILRERQGQGNTPEEQAPPA